MDKWVQWSPIPGYSWIEKKLDVDVNRIAKWIYRCAICLQEFDDPFGPNNSSGNIYDTVCGKEGCKSNVVFYAAVAEIGR